MSSSLSLSRSVLVAGILVLGLAACGRRGALEPPPDASASQAQQQSASPATPQGAIPSPIGTPRASKASRGYTIPKKPFILDPIL